MNMSVSMICIVYIIEDIFLSSYSQELRRSSTADLPATTHLVCHTTDSAKYKAAAGWSISTVSLRCVLTLYSTNYLLMSVLPIYII